ncbi:MAB_1171c family putative transporter [Amycolatopsis sp. cg5]|uniref:MAB_1171c family putative transporter n=1 Tax=Amycolatopsis sp. cg5 TaxID=3238802 RepID=UPI0035257A48
MVLFAVALGWRIYQIKRTPRSLPAWAVMITIACFLGSFLTQQKVVDDWIDAFAGNGISRLVSNVVLTVGLCALLIFFLGSALGPQRYRRVAVELIPLGVTLVLLTISLFAMPAEIRGQSLNKDNVHIASFAVFYLGAGLYMFYGLVACFRWMLRYQRTADRNLSVGLRIAGAGMASLALGAGARALYIMIAWVFGPTVPILLTLGIILVIVGALLFLSGITYPGVRARIDALRRRLSHRRQYEHLSPLWTVLVEAYPNIVLNSGPRPRGAHRRFYRRVIEIRDGLVQLSPYLEGDLNALATANPDGAAAELRSALARQASGEETDHRAHLVLPGGGDIEADVQPLLALSAALKGS